MAGVWDNPNFVKNWNDTYGLTMERAPVRTGLIFPWMHQYMGTMSGKKMLDLGCGNGNLIRYFKNENFAHWTGIDSGSAVLESTQDLQDDPRIEIIQADICTPLENQNEKYDTVQSFFVIEEIPVERFQGYWNNIHNCLKPGGDAYVVCNHPARAFYYDTKSVLTGVPNEKYPDHKGYFDRDKTSYTLEVMNSQKGFEQKANYFHKTLSDIVNAALRSGLQLKAMEETLKGVTTLKAWENHQPASGDNLALLMLKLQRA
jgi:2-polyprenyl-3-methyl-5-hydroxy-6-metoxy-1,4-benzoquinol methylase